MLYNSIKLIFVLSFLTQFPSYADEKVIDYFHDQLKKDKISVAKQSYCFTQENSLFSTGKDLKQNPASVTKLFTSHWAIYKKGLKFRFENQLFIDQEQLYLKGSSDPYLLSQQLLLFVEQLIDQAPGHYQTLTIKKGLLLDWQNNEAAIKAQVLRLFNPAQWDKKIKELINQNGLKRLLTKNKHLLSVKRILFTDKLPSKVSSLDKISLKSPPLYRQLKEVNKYSNNFYFDQMVSILGDYTKFNHFIAQDLKISSKEFHFFTGSGLGKNYLKCTHVIKLLKRIEDILRLNDINLNDLLPITGIDQGTLVERMPMNPGYSWAKTGTLRTTSALAGIINSSYQKEYFVFLNNTSQLKQARTIQDLALNKTYQYVLDLSLIDYDENVLDIVKESLIEWQPGS